MKSKRGLSLLLALLIGVELISLTSCGSKNVLPNEEQTQDEPPSIIGVWEYVPDTGEEDDPATFVFSKSGFASMMVDLGSYTYKELYYVHAVGSKYYLHDLIGKYSDENDYSFIEHPRTGENDDYDQMIDIRDLGREEFSCEWWYPDWSSMEFEDGPYSSRYRRIESPDKGLAFVTDTSVTSLVGTWRYIDDESEDIRFSLFSNGTCQYNGVMGTWTITDGYIQITGYFNGPLDDRTDFIGKYVVIDNDTLVLFHSSYTRDESYDLCFKRVP